MQLVTLQSVESITEAETWKARHHVQDTSFCKRMPARQTNHTGRNKTATGKNLGQTEKKNVAKWLLEFEEEWEKYDLEKIILRQKQ